MNPLDVTWIDDEDIAPPGPKMVICVEPYLGFYFRINSHSDWEPCVGITREPEHMFLKWDSFIECTILDLDDYIISQAMRKKGIIGKVSNALCDPLIQALSYASGSRQDRNAIRVTLEKMK